MPPSSNQDTFDLTEFSKIKIIVVPISPQKKENFRGYHEILKKFSTVSLSELTPPDSQTAKYSEQFYHDGVIHFDFVTSYNRDVQQLEEIEVSRQILGVIGFINCKQVGDLHDGYKQFHQILQRYPTSLAHRCFAFEPQENQPDNTKGLIMIPDVGDVSFYLQTMIADFTADILLALSLMAGQLERKTQIVGPIMISPFFSITGVEGSGAGGSSSMILDSGGVGGNGGGGKEVLVPSQGNGITPYPDNSLSTPTTAGGGGGGGISSTNSSIISSLNNAEKIKKRTPARIQKLLGDLYLLAGRLDLAIGSFVTAMEGAKLNNDYQWQASALEGYICAQLVSLISDCIPKNDDGPPMGLLSSREIMELALESKKLYSFVCELPERYREVVILYEKSHQYGTIGYYPILQINAALRIANFLSFAFLSSFSGTFVNCAGISWSNEAKSLTAEIALRMASTTGSLQPGGSGASSAVTNTLIPQQSTAQVEKAVLQNGTGVTRLDILTWITRISLTGNEFLTPKDYLIILNGICALCSRIKAYRKHAFYLRLVATVTRHLDSQQASLAIANNSSYSSLKGFSLVAFHHVSNLLESPFSLSEDDSIWVETYASFLSPLNSTPGKKPTSYAMRYGWPALRIGILMEAIAIADSDKDHINTIIFCARLLKKLYRYLNRKEQQLYSDLLLKVVFQHRKQLAAESSKTSLIKFQDGIELCVPLLLNMVIVQSTSRYLVTQHQPKTSHDPGVKEAFLYSPFAKKKTELKDLIFAADEMVHVDATFANPYLFEIDIQMMALCGDGLEFKALSVSTLIPAESDSHTVRLSCIPTSSGSLNLTGVKLRMLGGCIEETAIPMQRHLKDLKKFTSDGLLRKETDQERFGKRDLEFINGFKKAAPDVGSKTWTLPVTVIPQQPILELLETSLGSHQAITLFEGERSSLSFTIRNIGTVPINYIFMRIQNTMVAQESDESPYETEVYQKSINAFYPLESLSHSEKLNSTTGAVSQVSFIGNLVPVKLDAKLQSGEQLVVHLGVFGKKNCTGGLVQISYGNLTTDSPEDTFCTRELSIPFLLTVVRALTFKNTDVLQYSTSSSENHKGSSPALMAVTERSLSVEEIMMNPKLSTTMDSSDNETNTFLLTFDFHNEWDEPFKVTFDIYNDEISDIPTSSSTTILHAGVTKRIILPISRFLLSKAAIQNPIPTPAGKQFVLSKHSHSYPEGLSRALFWYKEHFVGGLNLRGRMVLRWTCSNGRQGFLPFREFDMLPRFIPIMKSDSIVLEGSFSESESVVSLSPTLYQCSKNSTATLLWTVTNHIESPIRLIFRACPVQDNVADPSPAEDVMVIGSSTRLLESVPQNERNFKIIAHVERLIEKREIKVKSKYEAPEVVLGEIENISWFKGVSMIVT